MSSGARRSTARAAPRRRDYTETARWCAEWADGLITVNAPVNQLRKLVATYRDAGGRGKLRQTDPYMRAGP